MQIIEAYMYIASLGAQILFIYPIEYDSTLQKDLEIHATVRMRLNMQLGQKFKIMYHVFSFNIMIYEYLDGKSLQLGSN